jgi:dTDP-3,4-didehydro-2,6-dideoxy-alpha-D-glucose 3-reductase
MNKKNIGVLGCAKIAERFLIPSIVELSENFNLIGIASRTKEKAELFASKFNTKAFYGYEELINVKGLQAIYIPLPNSLHYEWVKKSLQKGLHVLVEKPLACSHGEVIELTMLAKKKNLVLIENFQFRFHSQLKYIKKLMEEGTIGELRNINSAFGFPLFDDKNNIRYKKELGGGALLDAGAYPIKISQIFMGNDISVLASNLVFDNENGVVIWGSAFLKQKKGELVSHIAFGFDNYYQCNIELWGTKGKIYTNRIFTAGLGIEPILEVETQNGKKVLKIDSDHHFKNILKHFYRLIVSENSSKDEYEQNINQARLVDEVRNGIKR